MADFFFHLLNWETLKVVLFFFFKFKLFFARSESTAVKSTHSGIDPVVLWLPLLKFDFLLSGFLVCLPSNPP